MNTEKPVTWPTPTLENAVNKYRSETRVFLERDESETEDITPKAKKLLSVFMPIVKVVGPDLWLERYIGRVVRKLDTWGGMLVRALQHKKSGQCCLQYLLVYTRQHTVVSIVWWVAVPILMGVYSILLTGIPLLSTAYAFFPLLITGIASQVKEGRISSDLRSTSLLPLFYILLLFTTTSWIFSWVLIGIGVFAFFTWLLDLSGKTPWTHPMDYVPIFVWIKYTGLSEEPDLAEHDDWDFDCVCYDAYHYRAMMKTGSDLRKKIPSDSDRNEEPSISLRALISGTPGMEYRHAKLLMDNPWHSLAIDTGLSINSLYILGFIMAFLLFIDAINMFSPFQEPRFLPHAIAILVIVFLHWLQKPYDLNPVSRHYTQLDELRLEKLWNLKVMDETEVQPDTLTLENPSKGNISPSLVVVTKLQYPFKYKNNFKTFRDESVHLYDIIRELQELTSKKSRRQRK